MSKSFEDIHQNVPADRYGRGIKINIFPNIINNII